MQHSEKFAVCTFRTGIEIHLWSSLFGVKIAIVLIGIGMVGSVDVKHAGSLF